MARKKYESDRMSRTVSIVGGKQLADVSPLASAVTARSEQISNLVTNMQKFVVSNFEKQAEKEAAKIALENDPLKVLSATKDSIKIVDQLAFANSSKKLKLNLSKSLNTKILNQVIESSQQQDSAEIFDGKVNQIINQELQSIRPVFDSPLFEADFRESIQPSISKTVENYETNLVKSQLEELKFNVNEELNQAAYIDMTANDFNLTATKKHIKDNKQFYVSKADEKKALNDARTTIYKNYVEIIKNNKNPTQDEKKMYKDLADNIIATADADKNMQHRTIGLAIQELVVGSSSVSLGDLIDSYKSGVGTQVLDNDADNIVGVYLNLKKENPNADTTAFVDELLAGVNEQERFKLNNKFTELDLLYEKDPVHFNAQLDGVNISLKPNGEFADKEAATAYLTQQYLKTQSFNSKDNYEKMVASMKRIKNPLLQYEYLKTYLNNFSQSPEYNAEAIVDDLLNSTTGLPKEDQTLLGKMSYLMTYDDATAQTILQGIDERQKVTDEKSPLKVQLKNLEDVMQGQLQKRNVAMKPSQFQFHMDLIRDYIAGMYAGEVNFVPSGDDVVIATEAIFGIERNNNGDIVHGYSESGDGNLWNANKAKMKTFNGEQITKDDFNDVIKENLNATNIKKFLLTEERDADGALFFQPIDDLPPGFIKKVIEPVFTNYGKGVRVGRDVEIDFTDDFINSLFITNADENADLFYLSDRSSDSQHDDRRIIRMPDGRKVFFNAYGFVAAFKEYEQFVETIKYQRKRAGSRYDPETSPTTTILGIPISGDAKAIDFMRKFKTKIPTFSEFQGLLMR